MMLTFPAGYIVQEETPPRLVVTTTSPGRGLDGRQQGVTRENRYWAIDYQVFGAWGRNAGPLLAFLDDAQGSAVSFNMPVSNTRTPRYDGTLYGYAKSLGLSEDEARQGAIYVPPPAEGLPWSWLPLPEHNQTTSIIPAVAGASLLILSGHIGSQLQVGSFFSANDFLYRVADRDGMGTVRFNPPLREPITAGQAIEINNPRIRVTFADDAAQQAAHDAAQWGGPFTLSVVESRER